MILFLLFTLYTKNLVELAPQLHLLRKKIKTLLTNMHFTLLHKISNLQINFKHFEMVVCVTLQSPLLDAIEAFLSKLLKLYKLKK